MFEVQAPSYKFPTNYWDIFAYYKYIQLLTYLLALYDAYCSRE